MSNPVPARSETEPTFWHGLIDERAAADFLGFSPRHLQGLRYRGGGPRFVRVSSRCVRYRRTDLRQWAEERLRTSTREAVLDAAHTRSPTQ